MGNIEKSLNEDQLKKFLSSNNVAVSRVNLLQGKKKNKKLFLY